MSGNNKVKVVLTERDQRLLRELAGAKIIDRELAKEIAPFASTVRANTRLLQLTRAGLLKRFFTGTTAGGRKSLYCLSKKGAEAVQVPFRQIQRSRDSLIVGDIYIEHQLEINSIWVQLKFRPIPVPDIHFVRFLTFPSALSKQSPLIPDGYFELNTPSGLIPMFCEVDRGTETLKVFSKKISLYLQLAVTGEFQVLFKQSRFRVLVATHSERRLNMLKATASKHTDKIFWFATLNDINKKGLFAAIWQRPTGASGLPLL